MRPAVLFDFGGTLDSDGVHWLDRFYAIYEALGPAGLGRPRIKEAFYRADAAAERHPHVASWTLVPLVDELVAAQFRELGLEDRAMAARIARAFTEPCERHLRRNASLLASLASAGYGLGIVSNFYGNLRTLCDEFELTASLGVALDSAEVGLSKPDPRFFSMALERLGATAADAVFVGDSLDRDIGPAKSLGMRTVWLRDDLEPPCRDTSLVDATITQLTEVSDVLAAWR
jgi:HAD superfamily hydrolase (TIGR01509 family)